MHIAHDLVARVTESATNLKITVDSTSNVIQNLGFTTGMLRPLIAWLGLGLVIFGICLVRGRLAGYVAIGIGSAFFLDIWERANAILEHFCSNKSLEQCFEDFEIPSSFFTFPAAMTVLLGLLWYSRGIRHSLNQPLESLESPGFLSLKGLFSYTQG
jgi:hypothetical protein